MIGSSAPFLSRCVIPPSSDKFRSTNSEWSAGQTAQTSPPMRYTTGFAAQRRSHSLRRGAERGVRFKAAINDSLGPIDRGKWVGEGAKRVARVVIRGSHVIELLIGNTSCDRVRGSGRRI